ncbi:MAG: insulinase family protein [Candidatus Kapabacteria bacterium]|nr:insulinase family protein [Candidatus Kapabacteria bacterium]
MNIPEPTITEKLPTFTFPAHSVEFLSNSIKCFFVPDNNQDLVHISVKAKYGAASEAIPGTESIMANLLPCGTPSYSTLELADAVDAIGAGLRVSKQWDSTGMSIGGLAEFGTEMIKLLADCICNPLFTDAEFSRIRNEAISELQYEITDPRFTSSRAFVSALIQNHPYSHSRIGTLESLQSITVSDVKEFYQQMRTNAEWYIVVSGKYNYQEVKAELEQQFATLTSTTTKRDVIPVEVPTSARTAYVHLPESLQSTILVGFPTVDVNHPDYPALHILVTILGGYFSSRFNSILREEKGYTYGAFASVDNRFHISDISVGTSVGNQHTADTLRIINEEFNKIATEQIPEEELQLVVQFMLGSFARSTETPQQIAGFIHGMEILDTDVSYYERFVQYLSTVTPQSLFPAQQRLFSPSGIVYAASGDGEVLKQALSVFAPPQEVIVN